VTSPIRLGADVRSLDGYPRVRLQILSTNQPVDLIEQKIDVAMRLRTSLDSDASLQGERSQPAPASFWHRQRSPLPLRRTPGWTSSAASRPSPWWTLGVRTVGRSSAARRAGRFSDTALVCGEISTVRNAAIAGLGVTFLPDHGCRAEIKDGRLVRVLPLRRPYRDDPIFKAPMTTTPAA
jgi:DNA-binding transcriptional LysR family regulator